MLAIAILAVATCLLLSGLIGALLPAFGIFPVLGLTELTLDYLSDVFSVPGIYPAIRLSLATGLLATAISCAATFLLLASIGKSKRSNRLMELAAPLLAVPHAAAAFGIAFMIGPAGWISRLFATGLGMDRPPDVVILNDPLGLSLVLGLVLKEIPFLVLMGIAALPQTKPQQSFQLYSTLGYNHATGWLKTVGPQLYRRIRLPIFAVLCFSVSVVDVAIILGPTTPPTLAVLITQFMSAPDLNERLVGSALAVVQLGVLFVALMVWVFMERLSASLMQFWIASGARKGAQVASGAARIIVVTGMALLALGVVSLAVWSLAGFWSFPDIWPDKLELKNWIRFGPELIEVLWPTLGIATVSSAASYLLALVLLSGAKNLLPVIYLALLVPQVVFLPGIANLMLGLHIGASVGAVTVIHILFVLPYVVLTLYGPYSGLDTRYESVALSLGVHPMRVFMTVRLPMLLGPSIAALAIGFAVSVAQYLPTFLIGGGRVTTVTTEAIALASGGDRRVIGLYGLAQMLMAVIPFGLAILLPQFIWRHRRGMQNG